MRRWLYRVFSVLLACAAPAARSRRRLARARPRNAWRGTGEVHVGERSLPRGAGPGEQAAAGLPLGPAQGLYRVARDISRFFS